MNNHRRWALLPPRFPRLFSASRPPSFECGGGWAGIAALVCQRLASLLDEHPGAEIEVQRVKEKMGSLRLQLHINGRNDALIADVRRALALGRRASEHCCERCGAVGTLDVGPPCRVRCELCAEINDAGER